MVRARTPISLSARSRRQPSALRRSGPRTAIRASLRTLFIFIGTTLFLASHSHLRAQQVSTQAPLSEDISALPDAPSSGLPIATVLPSPNDGTTLVPIESVTQSGTRTADGYVWTLDGNVFITYGDHSISADHISYNQDTGDVTATGHLLLTGGANAERISASHGTLNMNTQTGRFYDVDGSVGIRPVGSRTVYVSENPFLFAGRLVVKTGPQNYDVYDGSVTSCRLPNPDWRLYAGHISVDSEKARMSNSIFRLINVPVLYLPYVTHPVDSDSRQSGILIPVIGESSSKGFIIGESVFFVLNRSSDLTVGAQYYSIRGWEQMATFRYRGLDDNSVNFHYTGLLDRGYTPVGGVYTNQGGEDVTLRARHDLAPSTRAVANIEYLSSYVYREAFSGNFNQAVSSDVLSTAYLVHQWNGFSADVYADRYQGLKRVPIAATPATPTAAATPGTPGEQVRIFHTPSLDFSATDHHIGDSPFLWNMESSAAGLKRVQPNFATGGVVERIDLHPQIALPFAVGGWRFLSSFALRETAYSRSRVDPTPTPTPVESTTPINRTALELQVDIRPPVIERTFSTPKLAHVFGTELRHTIEPELVYSNIRGIDNFNSLLRFDDIDVASNTDEIQYGVTQHLFGRNTNPIPCKAGSQLNTFVPPNAISAAGTPSLEDGSPPADIPTPASTDIEPETAAGANANTAPDTPIRTGGSALAATPTCTPPQREWISWRLTQKYFFDPNFGGAVLASRRNIFTTTLDLSGIAFLTEPRNISPLVSRLRVRTTDHIDVGWDFDLDTGAKKFTADNVYLDTHQGNTFAGLSYARLNAPGRSYIEGFSSAVSNFNQLRLLLGYGQPTKRGLSVAANTGLDLNLSQLQYGALQASYNWDCCGLSVEYRKFELGSVRNEGVYRFNFTLANIGAAGNLRRAERLF